jgi:hypothetical protein
VSADVESARSEWEEAYRRLLEAARDPQRAEALHRQLEVVRDELRRRVGSAYTLRELAAEYRRADAWAREAVAERAPSRGWVASLSLVEGAAFHLHARGAVDFEL